MASSSEARGRESRASQEGPGHPPQEVTFVPNMFMQNCFSAYHVPGSLLGILRRTDRRAHSVQDVTDF